MSIETNQFMASTEPIELINSELQTQIAFTEFQPVVPGEKLLMWNGMICTESDLLQKCPFLANLSEAAREEVIPLYEIPRTAENLDKFETQKQAEAVQDREVSQKQEPKNADKPTSKEVVPQFTVLETKTHEAHEVTKAPETELEAVKKKESINLVKDENLNVGSISEVQGGGGPDQEELMSQLEAPVELSKSETAEDEFVEPIFKVTATKNRNKSSPTEFVIQINTSEIDTKIQSVSLEADDRILPIESDQPTWNAYESEPEVADYSLPNLDPPAQFDQQIDTLLDTQIITNVFEKNITETTELEKSSVETAVINIESLIAHVGTEKFEAGFEPVLPVAVERAFESFAEFAAPEAIEHLNNLKILTEAGAERLQSLTELRELDGIEAEQIIFMLEQWHEEILATLQIEHDPASIHQFIEEIILNGIKSETARRIISEEEATHEYKRLFRSTQGITQDMIEKLQAQIGRRALMLIGLNTAA